MYWINILKNQARISHKRMSLGLSKTFLLKMTILQKVTHKLSHSIHIFKKIPFILKIID
jgi:hypothetical protein